MLKLHAQALAARTVLGPGPTTQQEPVAQGMERGGSGHRAQDRDLLDCPRWALEQGPHLKTQTLCGGDTAAEMALRQPGTDSQCQKRARGNNPNHFM